MITENGLRQMVQQVKPEFFAAGGAVEHTDIVHLWPLPAGRILFACRERWLYHDSASTIRLHVLDQVRGQLHTIGNAAGFDSAELAVLTAIEWMQGLRSEDLTPFDKHMIEWLGEMAYRMTPKHLEQFQHEYFEIPPDAWGTHENPNDAPAERLADLLAFMGYGDEAITEHLF